MNERFGKYQGLRQETWEEKKRVEKLGLSIMECFDGYTEEEVCNTIWRFCALLLTGVGKSDRKRLLKNIGKEAEYIEKFEDEAGSN